MNEADHDKRVVLPQWLPFSQAAAQREATAFRAISKPVDLAPTLEAFRISVETFRSTPQPYVAVELLGVAEILGSSEDARLLAEYIAAQPFLGPVVKAQAAGVLGQKKQQIARQTERQRIKQTKQRVRDYPHDAIAWVEQARLYTVLGMFDKAKASVLVGFHLAPGDRFVARSAIRFFVHCGKWDEALKIANKAYALSADPLIFGPLVSVASRVGKLPSKLKPEMNAALSSKEPFIYSEALEAFGTLELSAGADKRAKPFFKKAWTDPTTSVVGHSQWLRKHLPSLAHDQRINFWDSKEAVSWLRFATLDFEQTLVDTNDWALEEPYSRAPHILGSNAACMIRRYDDAIEFAKRGLIANPKDDILQNNLAFAYLRAGNVSEGEKAFAPLLTRLEDKNQVAIAATHGLLLMEKGNIEGGEKQYFEAIRRALDKKDRRLALRASLNYIVSALDITKSFDPAFLKSAQNVLDEFQDPNVLGLAQAIVTRLKNSDLTGSDVLSTAAREFCAGVEGATKQFEKSIAANLLAAAPKPGAEAAKPV